jgi:hypothetical protein
VEIQKTLKRLVIEKIHPPYQTRIKLKENVTYGSNNETVQFETVLESEDGTPSKLVHIHYVRHGSRREETRRYAESLARFIEKYKDYRRLTGQEKPGVFVLVVPQKNARRNPDVDWSLFPEVEGFLTTGWVFSCRDLGYDEGTGKPVDFSE